MTALSNSQKISTLPITMKELFYIKTCKNIFELTMGEVRLTCLEFISAHEGVIDINLNDS